MDGRVERTAAFTLVDLLCCVGVLSVLAGVIAPVVAHVKAKSQLGVCLSNVAKVNRAALQFAADHDQRFPEISATPAPGGWWSYREEVKGYLGLKGPSSPSDKVFACPNDRGYGEGSNQLEPFWQSSKHSYTSYVFNGVNLPGIPNIAGRAVASIKDPSRTLLVMEWSAHAPLSWHRSRTGKRNTPFYNDAENVVGFVDGHVALIPIYYDGLNAAYTRDPVPGYSYKFSAD